MTNICVSEWCLRADALNKPIQFEALRANRNYSEVAAIAKQIALASAFPSTER